MLKVNKDWSFKEVYPEVTGYTTTYNCVSGNYPFEEAILSWNWCDKIVVVDGGSTDGTREKLEKLKEQLDGKMDIYDIPMDLEMPGKDGNQKAMALAMCATPFAIQFDVDEFCRGDVKKWRAYTKNLSNSIDILNLPVLEPYGNIKKIRINTEHNPVKWRIFRVKPEITHGIPDGDRMEIDGKVYSKGGSDGCTPVHVVHNHPFPSKPTERARKLAELKQGKMWVEYKDAWKSIVEAGEPYVLHVGHVELKQKIEHYLKSWKSWWNCLYNKSSDNNIFFPGIKDADITDKMIDEKVAELKEKTPTIEL